MISKKKGTGIAEVILGTFIIIYIVLPLLFSITNKSMLYHQTSRIKQATEMAAISLIRQNEIESFSSGFLFIDTDEEILKYMIAEEISYACISSLRVKTDDINVNIHEPGSFCGCGMFSEHFMISVNITATLDFLGEKQFNVHNHIEFPVNK
ncbi:MAG: hypothetical protein WC332_02020 [Clostridia bacterium]|jgi:hypothetical protein